MYEHGTRYYIQRSTDGGEIWIDVNYQSAEKISPWRSGRFVSALDQVNVWKADETAADGVEYRIVKRTFLEDVVWTEGGDLEANSSDDDPMDGANDDDDDDDDDDDPMNGENDK